jgi:hypothetical protein
MDSNVADSPYASDNDSNNPYDVLRDDDEDEVPIDVAEDALTDTDQKESEEDSTSNQSTRPSEPSESDYESANDTMSLAGKKPRLNTEPTDTMASINSETQAPSESNTTPVSSPKFPAKVDYPTEPSLSDTDSKPRAKSNPVGNRPSGQNDTNSSNPEDHHMQDASRRLFDNRKPPPAMTAEEISPSDLDNLIYEARQHDTTLFATSGNSTPALSQQGTNMVTANGNITKVPVPTPQHGFRPFPIPPQGGRGRGGRVPQRNNNQPRSGIQHPLAAGQTQANQMDIDNPLSEAPEQAPLEPDFSFSRPTYVAPTPPTPARKQFYRCTWRVDIPKNTSPEEGLRDAILEIWSVLKDADRRLIIYPWHQSAHGRYKALSDMTKFPKKKETLIRYFKDAYFRPHAGPMYIRVYLGCDLTMEDLGKQTSGFFNSPKNRLRVGFWMNPLQFEEIVEIGWLFHSTPGMNANTIQDEIFRHCGIKTALRWKIIAAELKGELPKALQIRAYHVSVRREDMAAAKFVLTRKIFARHRRSHFIGGSPMRLIPIMKDVSPNHKQKCIYYIALQSSFLNKIDSMESWEIINLNNVAVGLNGASLRRLILEIPLRDDPSRQAFLSVDRAFNNASTKFYFYKSNASECRSRITTLLPYLVFTNLTKEKGIKSCFSGDANERAKGVRWDSERMEVMTADDEIMDMYHSIYDDDDDQDLVDDFARKILLDFAEVTGANSAGAKPAARATKVQETDAVSLFSRSTIASRQNPASTGRSQSSDMSEDDNENDSDDTPRTVNKTLSTADTVGLSSLSTTDIQTKMDLMAQAITKFIPNTPENQAFLAQFSAAFSSSPRVGSPSDSQHPGASAPGQSL